jgi:hypothetical protein
LKDVDARRKSAPGMAKKPIQRYRNSLQRAVEVMRRLAAE